MPVLTNGKLFLGKYDLSGDTNRMEIHPSRETPDDTVMGVGARIVAPGLPVVDAVAAGLFTVSNNENLHGLLGVEGLPLTLAQLGAEGEVCHMLKAYEGSLDVGGAVGDLAPYNLKAMAQSNYIRGLLAVNGTKTGNGPGTAFDNLGAVASGKKLYAAIHLTAVSGFTSLAAKVQSDDNSDFTSATDEITFATLTDLGYEWKELAGPITDTWWRATWTLIGTSATFVVAIGIG